MTEWRAIPGFPGYDVSDEGQVRSYHRRRTGIGASNGWFIDNVPVCLLQPAIQPSGYLFVNLARDSKRFTYRIADIVLLAFVGPHPKGLDICHNDGDKTNNHLSNLRYDTHRNNMRDACDQGKKDKKLTRGQVLVIRAELAVKDTPEVRKQLAKRYGLSEDYIRQVGRGYRRLYDGGSVGKATRKLSNDDVRQIRTLKGQGWSLSQLARQFAVDQSMISLIVNNKRRICKA